MFVTKIIKIFKNFCRFLSVKEIRDFGYTLFFHLRLAHKKNTSSRMFGHLNQSEALELSCVYLSLNYARLNFKIVINTFMRNVQAYKIVILRVS